MEKTKELILLITIILGLLNSSLAQVYGTVSGEDANPLPFATVYIEGTTQGTTTNEKGEYKIFPGEGNHTLVFQYVGFKQTKRDISLAANSPVKLDIVMPVESVTLAEIEVKANAEDPAYPIIRKAIEKRNFYLNQVSKYSCDVYVKGNIKMLDAPEKILGQKIGDMEGMLDSTRQGILYLSESVSQYYFKAPDKTKEVMLSSKVAGDDNGFSFNSATDMEMNFYRNRVEIGRQIVSPIADAAFNFYKYHLEGSFLDKNNRLIYKINVLPKNASGPVFGGDIYIADGSWNIYSTDLSITGNNMLQPLIDTLFIRQTYILAEKPDTWRIFSQTYEFTGGLLGFRFGGSFTGIFRNYDLHPDFADDFFGNTIMSVNADANKKDSTYWNASRPVPLTEDERHDYRKKDSLEVVRNSDTYLDSIDRKANHFEVENLMNSYTYSNSKKKSHWVFESPLGNATYNLVQGFALTSGLKYRKSYGDPPRKRFAAGANISYGFSEKKWRPSADITFDYNRKFNGVIQLSGGQKLAQFNENEPISERLSSFYNIFFRRNYISFYNEKYFLIKWQQEISNGILVQLSGKRVDRTGLLNHADYSLFYRDSREFASNIPGHLWFDYPQLEDNKGYIFEAFARIRPGQKVIDFPNSRVKLGTEWPEFRVGFKKGIITEGRQDDFLKIYASVAKEDIKIGVAGRSSFLAEAGIFAGGDLLYFADYHHFPGNETNVILDNRFLSAFRALPYYDYSTNDRWFRAHYEHNFDGFIMDKLPLLKKLNLSLVGGAAYLTTPDLNSYWELSAGIDRLGIGVARLLRFDIAASFLNGKYQGLNWLIGVKINGNSIDL